MPGSTDDQPRQEQTSSEGKLALEVPVLVREFEVYFPSQNATYAIRVGDMDPDTEPTGTMKRLMNLGYLDVLADEDVEDEEARAIFLSEAISEFQRDSDLAATGTLDEQTLSRLLEEHGS